MKFPLLAACALLDLVLPARAQIAPSIVWSEPSPGLGDNNVGAVAWSPADDALAVGSSDRWFRLRVASSGDLLYSVLEPKNSGGVGGIMFSHDGQLVGVRNQSIGLSFRVQTMAEGLSLGKVLATVEPNGLVTFAPDAQLLAATGGDGTISSWDFSDLTLFQVTGSGYQTVTTTFDFSPDGLLQTAASKGIITVRSTADGSVVKRLRGGSQLEFSHDSSLLAAWSKTPNQIVLWDTSTWTVVEQLVSANADEGVGALRFTPDDQRLVATGYAPFLTAQGWQQEGFIRFWSIATGAALVTYDQQTDIAVTSPVAFSPDGAQFAYGLYDGTVAVASTP